MLKFVEQPSECLFCVEGELPRGNQIPTNLSDINNVRQISSTGLCYIA
jgi:hypothetical protein